MTPQRLHAELLAAGAKGLEAYLQGALCDGTKSALHGTHRFCQASPGWLVTLEDALSILGHRSWMYREGADRSLWVLETSAKFLSKSIDPRMFESSPMGLDYVRGVFDADGGMPRVPAARLYFQFCQKNRELLDAVGAILEGRSISCGRVHNPSRRIDPELLEAVCPHGFACEVHAAGALMAPDEASADATQDEDIVHAS